MVLDRYRYKKEISEEQGSKIQILKIYNIEKINKYFSILKKKDITYPISRLIRSEFLKISPFKLCHLGSFNAFLISSFEFDTIVCINDCFFFLIFSKWALSLSLALKITFPFSSLFIVWSLTHNFKKTFSKVFKKIISNQKQKI